jgi:hypothetical protein
MWGYQLHDRPVLDTLIQPSETSSSNYQRLSWRSRETGEKWPLNFADEHLLCSYGSFTCRKSTTWDRWLYFPSEGRRATDFITLKIHRPRPGLKTRTLGPVVSTLTTTPPKANVAVGFWISFLHSLTSPLLTKVIIWNPSSLKNYIRCLQALSRRSDFPRPVTRAERNVQALKMEPVRLQPAALWF